ncbi:MAG: amidohydrolase [Firmicutes bacterium]|nr:amidohydrolase [Bacillota bacterium]
MNVNKEKAIKYIDGISDNIIEVSHKIWEYAELSLKEFKSAELYVKVCKEMGFEVKQGISGVETAFTASYGSGKPVIGILAEYDALSGLSQKGYCPEKEPLVSGASGHGCGHNMLGAGSFGAACAVKDYLEKSGKEGTVILFGCPGEEGGAAKAFMARDGVWKGLDCALTWHPGDTNEVSTGTCNSSIQVLYKYKGVAAHAAGNPEMGRSALDAVELLNIGVQFLREHMPSDCRIHYAIIDGGGVSPNVVQSEASVLYMVRSVDISDSVALQARVDKIAEGAALMTDTTYERQFIDGTANTVPNSVLEKLMHDNLQYVPLPEYTEEELAFAAKVYSTYEKNGKLPGTGSQYDKDIAKEVKEKIKGCPEGLYDFVMPFYTGDEFHPGSTDVGDVSWQTPAAQFNTVCFAADAPGHSWQNVSCGISPIGDKGTLQAAKVLACSAIDLFEKPEVLAAAKEELSKRVEGKVYICPIPQGAVPTAI